MLSEFTKLEPVGPILNPSDFTISSTATNSQLFQVSHSERNSLAKEEWQLQKMACNSTISRSVIPVVYIKTTVDQRSGKWQSKNTTIFVGTIIYKLHVSAVKGHLQVGIQNQRKNIYYKYWYGGTRSRWSTVVAIPQTNTPHVWDIYAFKNTVVSFSINLLLCDDKFCANRELIYDFQIMTFWILLWNRVTIHPGFFNTNS